MKKKILITDDDNNVYVFLERILKKRFNCETIWADNGKKGIAILETEEIDGLILDIHMPIMTGIETLGMIRKSSKWDNLPILVCTSTSDKDEVSQILSKGISGYLLKPIRTTEAVERIGEFLENVEK